ncbi:MAG: pyridoxal phosphate-dependent aminotransferase [Bacteroidota bacterium]
MKYQRMPIEVESPEEMGYENIKYNLAESSVRDRKMSELNANLEDLVLNYGDHRGLIELRNLISEDSKILKANQVLVCQAAAMSLFIVNTSILSANDHLIVIRPNYATNIETPKAISCEISYIDLSFESSFQIDIEQIKKSIQKNTKLISITTPHNPTGIVFKDEIINNLIELAEEKGIYLLIDETYRELNFQSKLKPYYAEKSKKVISISSLSKAYGLPGLRIGWIIIRDEALYYLFLAAKEQIIITNSVVDEYLALCAIKTKEKLLAESNIHLKANFEITKNWLVFHPNLEWIEPEVGAIGFVRFKNTINIDFSKFYEILYDQHQTIVGPGHWFEQSDRYFRLGFGYPTSAELIEGLMAIDNTINNLID